MQHSFSGSVRSFVLRGFNDVNYLAESVPCQEPRQPAQITEEQNIAPVQVDTDSGEDFEELPDYRVASQ